MIKSPIRVLREKNAHCIEGAILAAYILSLHGHKPLIMHLKTTKDDFDQTDLMFYRPPDIEAMKKQGVEVYPGVG